MDGDAGTCGVPAGRASRFAYFIATRAGKRKTLFLVLLVIPFWTSFLIRTYLLADHPGHGQPGRASSAVGHRRSTFRILGTPWAVLLGLVYGYLPLMVFPLYVTLERIDRTLARGVQGPGRRPLGDVPAGHAADRDCPA